MVYCGSRICGRTLTVIAMAYAIFKTGGKQYRVQTGDVIDVECINTLEEGAEASFDQVLMVENDGKVTVGAPMVEGLSEANKNAEILIAEGEAEYMKILSDAYADVSKQDFYSFVRSLDALKASMTGDNKTVILSPDSPIAQIFYGR